MENQELAVIEQPTELVNVAKESGIEISKAELITLKYVPFLAEIRKAEYEMKKINFENPTAIDILLAKEIRNKQLVKTRTGAEKFKATQKAEMILLNKLEDAACNLIEASCKVSELKLYNLEKASEIAEKARIDALRNVRIEEIKTYGENYAAMDLGSMSEEMYQSIFSGAKLNHEAKIKAELEAENARIEKEKQAAIEAENQRIEMERLRKENEIKEKQLELERIEAKKKEDAAAAELKAANDKAEAERKESERLAKIESDKQAKILAEQKAESDRLQKELNDKAATELKAEQDKIAAEKKALKAPDKEKIKQVAMQLGVIRDSLPTLKTEEGAKIILDIKTLIEKTINYSREKAETL